MAIRIKIETPIAFALTLTVCFVLVFYCWRIRKIRHRLTGSVQVSALPIADTAPAEEQMGIKKDVIATFLTVKAHELKDNSKEGCPICLVEYASAEVLRKLPLCGHVFHMRCVDSWLEKQVTCPVCRIVLTAKRSVHRPVPAWVLVNRPLPLPPSRTEDALELRSHSDVMASPLLEHRNPAMGIQTREHAAISDRWMAEAFVFGMSGSEDTESPRRTDTSIMKNAKQRSMEWAFMAEEVVECRVAPFRPLTMSPERCSFEFLPVVTAPTAAPHHAPFTPPPSVTNWV